MSGSKKRNFNRPVATREYRKVFTIFPEGEKTENCYFTILRGINETVNIIVKKGDKKNEPDQILSRAKKHIREHGVSKNEQIWLVIDVDGRAESSFKGCFEWEKTNTKYNLAISNPKFEYWLLMHFENGGDGVKNSSDCMTKLIKRIPSYTKSNISTREITKESCTEAVNNGERKHRTVEVLQGNCSTVYKLVKEILELK
ncbi:TPA: RloB domain-containing protein [Legionella pneumophila]|nr:RloB domain-containing protein [Legionella pneumophila]HAU0833426.1 RloB domain-containing protein [Legionella pneumophila]HAU0960235.1 RloB domain-containing protein [Legionella pneumophila]